MNFPSFIIVKRGDPRHNQIPRHRSRPGALHEINLPANRHDGLGNIISTTDPEKYTSYLSYNGRSRLTGRTNAFGDTSYFEYDGNGKIISGTDNKGNNTQYEYDTKGRPIKVTDPEGNITSYTYDANGNKETITDPNLIVTQFTYDALDRLSLRGLLHSLQADPTPERGGRSKRYFKLTREGYETLVRMREMQDSLWNGLPEIEFEAPSAS